MHVDWRHQKAVVLQSDDWGLCAWSADEAAWRVLADTPAFRSRAGRVYGRSTLESAADVGQLAALLEEFRGADGLPPVWQANTVMGVPDFAALRPESGPPQGLRVRALHEAPPRWRRPGLREAVAAARARGVWHPELHGWLHVPVMAWLSAISCGETDAERALEQQCLVCRVTQGGSEFGPEEPIRWRRGALKAAARAFEEAFCRRARSFCPPDYGWDEAMEGDLAELGLEVLQGWAEQAGLGPIERWRRRRAWRGAERRPFTMPARIALEPRGEASGVGRVGWRRAAQRARIAWAAGRPAVISTHRHNYAHLDDAWSAAGRAQLRSLLADLAAAGAVFLADLEVQELEERGWSWRAFGSGGVLRLRAAAAGVPLPLTGAVRVGPAREGGTPARIEQEAGAVRVWAPPGDYLVRAEAA